MARSARYEQSLQFLGVDEKGLVLPTPLIGPPYRTLSQLSNTSDEHGGEDSWELCINCVPQQPSEPSYGDWVYDKSTGIPASSSHWATKGGERSKAVSLWLVAISQQC